MNTVDVREQRGSFLNREDPIVTVKTIMQMPVSEYSIWRNKQEKTGNDFDLPYLTPLSSLVLETEDSPLGPCGSPPPPKKIISREKYENYYWGFVKAATQDEADIQFEAMIGQVNMELQPADDGKSWVAESPEPKEVQFLGKLGSIMSRQRAKGTSAETALLKYLQDKGILAVRNPLSGSKDKGDLTTFGKNRFTIEVKNVKRMELSTWLDEMLKEQKNADTEFGVVVHKRIRKGDPAEWYATMTVSQLSTLIELLS